MQAVLLILTEVTVTLNHSEKSQKYAGSRSLVVHDEGGKPCTIPHLKFPIQQALSLIPDVLICVMWETVYRNWRNSLWSMILTLKRKHHFWFLCICFFQWSESGGSSMACCGLDYSWQMLPAAVSNDEGKHVSKAYWFLFSLVMSFRLLLLTSGALLSYPCQPPPPHGRGMLGKL